MDELIFFGVIIAFSILDSILRGKKKAQQRKGTDGLPVPEPQPWEESDWDEDVPTYNADPSYDDAGHRGGPETVEPHYGQPVQESSTGMIPKDIWEEIAAMAGGRLPIEPAPAPEPVEPEQTTTLSGRSLTPRRQEPRSVVPRADHFVHEAHADYGTDPSERAPSEQDGLDPLAWKLSADARRARELLVSTDRHQLRQAVILQEVLGPPAAFRE